jgi:hypothetical protein
MASSAAEIVSYARRRVNDGGHRVTRSSRPAGQGRAAR